MNNNEINNTIGFGYYSNLFIYLILIKNIGFGFLVRCASFTNHTHPLLKGKRSVRSQKFKFVKFRRGICCHIKKGQDEKCPLVKNQPVSEN